MFTLTWVIVVVLVSEFFFVMFLSLSDNTPEDMHALWRPFDKLTSLVQQLRSTDGQLSSSGPPVGRVRQAVSSGTAAPRSSPDTRRSLGKFNFSVGTKGLGEGREVEWLEAVRSLVNQGEGYPASQMSLGDGLKSMEEVVESKNNIVNTPTSEMAPQANTGTFLEIRFLDGGGGGMRRSSGGRIKFFMFLHH